MRRKGGRVGVDRHAHFLIIIRGHLVLVETGVFMLRIRLVYSRLPHVGHHVFIAVMFTQRERREREG